MTCNFQSLYSIDLISHFLPPEGDEKVSREFQFRSLNIHYDSNAYAGIPVHRLILMQTNIKINQ